MALLDLLGRRWALRVLWELRDGALTFRELQARCEGMSSSVLNQRLRELRDAGIVGLQDGAGYRLTDDGRALDEAFSPLYEWAVRWGERSGDTRQP
jgi:DNA-binding HxlR family transcriptional regulator